MRSLFSVLRVALISTLPLAFASTAQAAPACAGIFNPAPAEVAPLLAFGERSGSVSQIPARFGMLSWNVHKGADPQLIEDYRRLSANADLVLFQEATDAPEWTSSIAGADSRNAWKMALSFTSYDGVSNGVAIGSRFEPLAIEAERSDVREPVLSTPKTMMAARYAIEGRSDSLLVVNAHAINFVLDSAFDSYLRQMLRMIGAHDGPLVVAGDFNTWSPLRKQILDRWLTRLGLTRLQSSDARILQLDHIYGRGVAKRSGQSLSQIRSSDHAPLIVDLEIAPSPAAASAP